jgi:hypothetical protein
MKANELRIGNYVNAEVNLLSLQIHKLMPADIVDVSKGIVEIYPIPLTEEIFKKCGFELKDNNYTINIDGWLSIGIDKDDNGVILEDCFKSSITPSLYIFYLHQLQNLYHALTNEELEINL